MGWWSTNKGGYSFADEGDEMWWGDGPADALDNAIAEIDKQFIECLERPATTHELIAGMRFSYPTIHVEPHEDEDREGLDSRDATTLVNTDAIEQPVVVDHGQLFEIQRAAEAWASYLRKTPHRGLTQSERDDVADRIDKAIASTRRTSFDTAQR